MRTSGLGLYSLSWSRPAWGITGDLGEAHGNGGRWRPAGCKPAAFGHRRFDSYQRHSEEHGTVRRAAARDPFGRPQGSGQKNPNTNGLSSNGRTPRSGRGDVGSSPTGPVRQLERQRGHPTHAGQQKVGYRINARTIVFNSNVAPKVKKSERGDKSWQCSCGKENKPWWKQCQGCSKRKD